MSKSVTHEQWDFGARASPVKHLEVVVLGVDLGTSCGWAVGQLGDPVLGIRPGAEPVRLASGVVDLAPKRNPAGWRYARLRDLVDALSEKFRPTHLAYEEVVGRPAKSGAEAGHVYGGLRAMVHLAAWDLELPFIGVPVSDVKRTATGRGKASKDEMVRAFRLAHGKVPATDDEADAWFVAAAALRVIRAR